jgi:SAM-dependent methyltransferase
VAADAATMPLSGACADFVISQFGIEYAGSGAFAEAARLLAPGGRFCSLSHFSGGAIDKECAQNERLLTAVENVRLFGAARATLSASFSGRTRRDPKPIDPVLDSAFAEALGKAANAVRAAPVLAARATLDRFLGDLTRLSARRFAFDPDEALGWLTGMEASLSAYLGRMRSMRAAALGRDKIDAIAAQFRAAGLEAIRAEPLSLDDQKPPAAWAIEARRPI